MSSVLTRTTTSVFQDRTWADGTSYIIPYIPSLKRVFSNISQKYNFIINVCKLIYFEKVALHVHHFRDIHSSQDTVMLRRFFSSSLETVNSETTTNAITQ